MGDSRDRQKNEKPRESEQPTLNWISMIEGAADVNQRTVLMGSVDESSIDEKMKYI